LALVIGVRFKRMGKVYFFDPGEFTFTEGDGVIVETVRGVEYGDVVMLPREVSETEVVAPLKPVIRVATEEDKRQVIENEEREREALVVGTERILEHKLDMKLVDVEYTFDGKKVVFYFTADGRVDFRELVRDLAARFRTRIELRQIGVRDEAKMLGGLGPCGRPVCCKSFMNDFIPVSIRMAKDQNISLNPTKISGLCGRLMCCLQFEHECYVKARKELPKQGADVITPDGPGEVTELAILQEKVKVRITLPDLSCDVREYAPADLKIVSREEREAAMKLLTDNAPVQTTPRPPRPAAEPKPWQKSRSAALEEDRQEHTAEKPVKVEKPEKSDKAEEASAQQENGEGRDNRPRRRRRPDGHRREENAENHAAEGEKTKQDHAKAAPQTEDDGEKKDRPRHNRRFPGNRRRGKPGGSGNNPSENPS